MNFSTSSTQILVVMEGFPKVVNTSLSRLGSSVEKTHDIRLKMFSNGIEQPTM